jgi:hypothetical protein
MKHDAITIIGFVIPVEWDKNGSAVSVSITTDSFEKYIVFDDPKGRELLNLIDQQVQVEGIVSGEDLVGNKFIKLDNYNLLGTSDAFCP